LSTLRTHTPSTVIDIDIDIEREVLRMATTQDARDAILEALKNNARRAGENPQVETSPLAALQYADAAHHLADALRLIAGLE
jgi:hypothetical protein